MYCVKCGVELADSEKKCPLCHTPVYFPGIPEEPDRPYPDNPPVVSTVNKKVIYLMLSFLFVIAGVVSIMVDVSLTDRVSWSGIVVGSLVLVYIVAILPAWFPRKSRTPAIFVPVDFAATALFLWYLAYATGGDWFLGFALPITGAAALITTAVFVLCYYIRRGYLYIFGGALIAVGGFTVLIEWLLHMQFEIPIHMAWSPYPAVALFLVGMMLIVIAIVRPFRESLYRIFSLYPPS